MSMTINSGRSTMNTGAGVWSAVPAAVPNPRPLAPTSAANSGGVVDARAGGGAVDRVTALFRQQFADWAKDPAKFKAMMSRVFGPNHDTAQAESLRQRALNGDFSWMPKVRFVSNAALNGAEAGYDNASKTVLMNEDLLRDPAKAASVFVEEAGHHLDNLLNTVDSKGDEGELFRRIIGSEHVSAEEEARIRSFQDLGTAVVDGKTVQVENFFGKLKKAFKKIGGAFKKGFTKLGGAMKKIGGAIKKGLRKIGKFIGPVLKLFNRIAPFLSVAALAIPGIGPVIAGVMKIATPIAAALNGDLKGALAGLVPGGVGGALGKVAGLAGGLPAKVVQMAQPFLDKYNEIKTKIAGLPEAALGRLGEIGKPLLDKYRELTGAVNQPIDAARGVIGQARVAGLEALPVGFDLKQVPGLSAKIERLQQRLVDQVNKPFSRADAALLEARDVINSLPETAKAQAREALARAVREAGADALVADPMTRNPIQQQRAEELLRGLLGLAPAA